jgi:hypothetical protein
MLKAPRKCSSLELHLNIQAVSNKYIFELQFIIPIFVFVTVVLCPFFHVMLHNYFLSVKFKLQMSFLLSIQNLILFTALSLGRRKL